MGVFIGVLGLVVGALLNRIANGLVTGRYYRKTACPYCGTDYDRWLGLEGALFQQMRCRSCGAPYLIRHSLVELATALLFVLLWRRYGIGVYTVFTLLYACAFVVMMATDWEERLIPNKVIYPAIAIALVGELLPSLHNWKVHLLTGGIAFAFFLLLYVFGEMFVRLLGKSPEQVVAFGAGDVKLATFIGLVLGYPDGFGALITGILLNGLIAVGIALRDLMRKRYNPLTAFPYGPALIFSALLFWLF